ncbi:MAG: FliM/FliN family flagellar motor switch protein [Lachnospiraceae bacterium]|nr:FliM/FliN family flagellar motor switch protein [Lachnospiraceae bacterium]
MAEVLSQSQIDALLSSIGENKEINKVSEAENQGKKQYKKYDFYSPKKFTKDRLRILKSVYDNYSRIASSQINSLFRVSSEVEVVTVEEQRYYEFGNALSESDILTLIDVIMPDNSKNPPILMHASAPVIVNMMDRMLGSVGDAIVVEDTYTYTDIEIVLYEKIVKYLIAAMKDAWGTYIKLGFKFNRLQKNPSMFQDIGVDETIVIIVLHVNMKDVSGKINICVPGNLLVSIFTNMDRRKHISLDEGTENKKTHEDIMHNLKNSVMNVTAQLGAVQLNLEDIYKLHVGDVINLNKPKDAEVLVSVDGQPWFKGQLGVHNRNVAVKLEDRIQDDDIKNKESDITVT